MSILLRRTLLMIEPYLWSSLLIDLFYLKRTNIISILLRRSLLMILSFSMFLMFFSCLFFFIIFFKNDLNYLTSLSLSFITRYVCVCVAPHSCGPPMCQSTRWPPVLARMFEPPLRERACCCRHTGSVPHVSSSGSSRSRVVWCNAGGVSLDHLLYTHDSPKSFQTLRGLVLYCTRSAWRALPRRPVPLSLLTRLTWCVCVSMGWADRWNLFLLGIGLDGHKKLHVNKITTERWSIKIWSM